MTTPWRQVRCTHHKSIFRRLREGRPCKPRKQHYSNECGLRQPAVFRRARLNRRIPEELNDCYLVDNTDLSGAPTSSCVTSHGRGALPKKTGASCSHLSWHVREQVSSVSASLHGERRVRRMHQGSRRMSAGDSYGVRSCRRALAGGDIATAAASNLENQARE